MSTSSMGGAGGLNVVFTVLLMLFLFVGVGTDAGDLLPEQPSLAGNAKLPLSGQMLYTTPSVPIPVHVTMSLEKLLYVNEIKYKFTADVIIILTWLDEFGAKIIRSSYKQVLANHVSQWNCSIWLSKAAELHSNQGIDSPPTNEELYEYCQKFSNQSWDSKSICRRYCNPEEPIYCCDSVYLPQLRFLNLVGLPLGQPTTDEISLRRSHDNGTFITRLSSFQGEFATPLAFQRFPYDRQELHVDISMPDGASYLIESALGKNLASLAVEALINRKVDATQGTSLPSDELTAWSFLSMRWECNNDSSVSSNRSQVRLFANWSADDPIAIFGLKAVHKAINTTNYYQTECKIIIKIKRNEQFYFWNMLFPVGTTVVLATLGLAAHPAEIELRLSTTVALFLALVALQFTTNTMLPGSSYLTDFHKFIILSYMMMGAIVFINLVTAKLVLWAQREMKYANLQKTEAEQGGAKADIEQGGHVLAKETNIKHKVNNEIFTQARGLQPLQDAAGRRRLVRSSTPRTMTSPKGYYFPFAPLFRRRRSRKFEKLESHQLYALALNIDRCCFPALLLFYLIFTRYVIFSGTVL